MQKQQKEERKKEEKKRPTDDFVSHRWPSHMVERNQVANK